MGTLYKKELTERGQSTARLTLPVVPTPSTVNLWAFLSTLEELPPPSQLLSRFTQPVDSRRHEGSSFWLVDVGNCHGSISGSHEIDDGMTEPQGQ